MPKHVRKKSKRSTPKMGFEDDFKKEQIAKAKKDAKKAQPSLSRRAWEYVVKGGGPKSVEYKEKNRKKYSTREAVSAPRKDPFILNPFTIGTLARVALQAPEKFSDSYKRGKQIYLKSRLGIPDDMDRLRVMNDYLEEAAAKPFIKKEPVKESNFILKSGANI